MRPSWAAPDESVAIVGRGVRQSPPVALVGAAASVVLLAGLETLEIAGRDDLRPGLRAVLVGMVLLQLPFAWLALRRSPPAAMLLLLCGLSAAVAGVAGAGWPVAVLGVAVVALIGHSLRWFPSVDAWPS